MHTLKILMKTLAIGFFYNRLERRYENVEPTKETVLVLMNRCMKLLSAVELIGIIFK